MEEELTAWLLGGTALAALIGGRINWDERPQLEILPAVTLQEISAPVEYHHGGRTDLQRVRVQADIWAATATQALAIKRALVARIEALQTSPSGVLAAGFIENDFTTDPETLGGSARVFRRIVDIFIWHTGA